MDRDYAEAFAVNWVECWNKGDLDAIVGHFDEHAVFRSPNAVLVSGNGAVEGKQALASLWSAAIEQTPSRHFTLLNTIWDEEQRRLAIVYLSDVDGRAHPRRACVLFQFDDDGHVCEGEAMYGIDLPTDTAS